MQRPATSHPIARWGVAGIVCLVCSVISQGFVDRSVAAAEPESLAQLVEQLDAEEFSERERAEQLLLAAGRPALAIVSQAVGSPSRETAQRARRIVRILHHFDLLNEFRRLGSPENDGEIDLEQGLYLIARIVQPTLERATIQRKLDALGTQVARRLEQTVAGRQPSEIEKFDAVRHVLFVDQRFHGNVAEYDHPDNSSLDRVLDTQQGLPILLSQLTIAVGRRAGVTLHGLALPRRYMVWYQPPAGQSGDERILDPFDQGKLLNRDELEDLLTGLGFGFDQMADLTPAAHLETLQRALHNLAADWRQSGRADLADDCAAYEQALLGDRESR